MLKKKIIIKKRKYKKNRNNVNKMYIHEIKYSNFYFLKLKMF